jgi:hypothetical protein
MTAPVMRVDAVAARMRAEQYRAEVQRARETARELAAAIVDAAEQETADSPASRGWATWEEGRR